MTWSWTCSFGFRFFANKARVSRRVVSHAQKIERIRDQRVVQTKWHDPREKTSTIPIHILQFPAFYLLSKTTLHSPKLPTTIKTAHFFSKEDTLKSVMKFTPQFTQAIFIPPFSFLDLIVTDAATVFGHQPHFSNPLDFLQLFLGKIKLFSTFYFTMVKFAFWWGKGPFFSAKTAKEFGQEWKTFSFKSNVRDFIVPDEMLVCAFISLALYEAWACFWVFWVVDFLHSWVLVRKSLTHEILEMEIPLKSFKFSLWCLEKWIFLKTRVWETMVGSQQCLRLKK